MGDVAREWELGATQLKKPAEMRAEAESKRQAAALARRLDPGPLPQNQQLLLQQAEELEAEAADLEAVAEALEQPRAALYRKKAEEARAIAESMASTGAGATVLDVAATWDRLAVAEEKSPKKKRPPSR
jgi:hypothetical protein